MSIILNGTTGITSTGITETSDNKVGIGTSLPDTPLEVKHSASSDAIKISGNADSVAPYLSFENQEGGTAYVRGRIRGASNGADGGLIFQTGSAGSMTERLRILSTGGITFNGDTSAANALDDYEEGTWTPTLLGSSTNPTVTYTLQSGHYTKIGNVVTLTFNLRTSARTGGSGTLQVGGIPFTPATSSYQAGSFGDMNNITFDTSKFLALMTANSLSYLFLEELVSGTGANVVLVTSWGAGGQLNGSITYQSS